MDYLIEQIIVMIVIGTAAGIVGAMVGVGGGIIISPVLTFMGLNPAQISSTSLISVSSTSLSSTIAYSRQGKIKYRLGIRMASFAIPGAANRCHVIFNSAIRAIQDVFCYYFVSNWYISLGKK